MKLRSIRSVCLAAATSLPVFLSQGCSSGLQEPPAAEQAQTALTAADAPSVVVLASGPGWRRIHVKGLAQDIEDPTKTRLADSDLVLLESRDGLATAPLPAAAKADLATAMPADPRRLTIVDVKQAEAVEAAMKSSAGAKISCSGFDTSFTKSLAFNKKASVHKGTEVGSFSGDFDVSATLDASVTGTAYFHVYQALCIPYWASFVKARVVGNADVVAEASVDAKFEKQWAWSTTLATIPIASPLVWVGIFPVVINFNAPIEAGINASAEATLEANGTLTAKGTFDLTCTTTSCSGTKSATHSWSNGGTPTASANLRLDVEPWAQASIRVSVFDDAFGYAQAGVRARIGGDLWAYAGNGCGDADGDGVSESVAGLTFDLRAGIDVTARASLFGVVLADEAWPILDKHLAFWNLLPNGGATSPMVKLSETAFGGVNAEVKMRPCWPYSDKMTYRVDWNDGTTTEVGALPHLYSKPVTRAYPSRALRTIDVTAESDKEGRSVGSTTTDTIDTRIDAVANPI